MSTPAERVMNKIRAKLQAERSAVSTGDDEEEDEKCIQEFREEAFEEWCRSQTDVHNTDLPAHKTPYYIQRMFDAADHQRDMERDDKLTGDRK